MAAWGERVRAVGSPARSRTLRPLRLAVQVGAVLAGVAGLTLAAGVIVVLAGRHAIGRMPVIVPPVTPAAQSGTSTTGPSATVTATAPASSVSAGASLTPPPVLQSSTTASSTGTPPGKATATSPSASTGRSGNASAPGSTTSARTSGSNSGTAATSATAVGASSGGSQTASGSLPPASGSASGTAVPEAPPPALTAPVAGKLLAPFGWAFSSVFDAWQEHTGVDLAASVGQPVAAPAAGVVTGVRSDALWGWVVSIALNSTYSTNLSALGTVSVHKGETVAAGQTIGTVGASPPAEANLPSHVFWQLFAGAHALNPLAP